MNPTFSCIYCQKSEPHVAPSKAHIFPDAMGGVAYTLDTVCKKCNRITSKEFEQSEIRKFSFFQSLWGIKSRRGKTQGVPATAEFEGETSNISLGENGLPKAPLVRCGKDPMGNKFYKIIGLPHMVERKKNEILSDCAKITWQSLAKLSQLCLRHHIG